MHGLTPLRPNRQLAFYALGFIVAAPCFALPFFAIGCWERVRVIRLVVPTGYSGRIEIRAAPGGASSRYSEPLVVKIDSNGHGTVSDAAVFSEWHVLEATQANGDKVEVESGLGDRDDIQVKLFELGTSKRGAESFYLMFVGTSREAWKVFRAEILHFR